MEVEVEILDVTDDEARALLLSIDPLAALAETQHQLHERLLSLTPTDSLELESAWRAAAERVLDSKSPRSFDDIPEQYLILVTCRDEKHQRELLARFQSEGMECKPLMA